MIWAVSLLTTELSPRSLTAYPINTVFGVWLENLEKLQGILFSALPLYSGCRRQPQSCFGKNQLLPNSISFSLLTTGHPKGLHDLLVRTSSFLSEGFILPMASSSGFGSLLYDEIALLTLAFAAPPPRKGLDNKIFRLVGSFCKKHAVTRLSCDSRGSDSL